MTEQSIMELVKAFAYGATPESLAEVGRINLEEAQKFEKDHVKEIEHKKAELKAGEWFE